MSAAIPPPRLLAGHGHELIAVSAGGAIGALARHTALLAWPPSPSGFPYTVVAINVSGSLLIGLLLSLTVRFCGFPTLTRPFLGVGVLGGYTTFSTYATDAVSLLSQGRWAMAIAAVALTPPLAVLAAWLGERLGTVGGSAGDAA